MFRERTASIEARLGARRLAWVQALGLAGLLVLVAVLVYGDHARLGGWVGDAWLTRAWYAVYPHTDFFSTVGHFLDLESMAARPANAVYRVALNGLFGADTGAWYGWQIGSGVVMCLALYALMRELGVRYFDAAAVVTLLVVFPAASSVWLWSPIVHASLSIALGAVGFILALRGFAAAGRRRLVLHGASLLLFVVSLLLYEVCLPFFLASFLLYALRAPRRDAVRRWLADLLVLVPLALLVSGASAAEGGNGVGGAIDHAGAMAGQLPGLLLGTLLPFDGAQPLAFVALLALYGWAGWTVRRHGQQDPLRRRLWALLGIAAAGLVVAFLGYLIYVPGLDYYRPLAEGIADRVNAVPALGWTLFLYATLAILATLVTQKLRQAPLVALAGTAAMALALGLSWVSPIEEESSRYVEAYEEGQRMMGIVERAVPDPPRDSAIWTFAQPVEISPGIPVFANYWNMTAAAALRYHDHSIRSFVGLLGTRFRCTPKGVVPVGAEYPAPRPNHLGRFGSRYGRTFFVDTVNGQFAEVDSRARCQELRLAFPRATEFPPPS